ncbi:2Fe-2S iron-sulfur cluster-binding protein [Halobacteriaceae archaeon GCM10025711]
MTTYDVTIEVPEDAEVDQAGETVTIPVEDSEYVLAAARNAGVWLPADCQQGWCTTCAARLESGEVDQSDARRYYDTDEDAGLILTCTAKPLSDLHIVSHQQDAMLAERAAHDLPPGNAKR